MCIRDRATPAPQSEAKTEPKPGDNTDITKLMNTTLGNILLAGILKDPESAGRIIADAITYAETPVAPAKPPEADDGPKSQTGADPKAVAKAKTPSDLAPKITK